MSVVTNLIFSFSVGEDENKMMNQVNSFKYGLQTLNLVSADYIRDTENRRTAWYGGGKFLEARLFVGAFNHLDLNEFIDHVKSLDWEEPECVQIIVKEQHDDIFRLINVFE
ncbi:MAG: hypothetical protein RIG62_02095 [Cyclobacteriaceae bacterium]